MVQTRSQALCVFAFARLLRAWIKMRLTLKLIKALKNSFKGSVHTWCEGTTPAYGTRWVLMWTHSFFKLPMLKFGHGAKVGTRSMCAHRWPFRAVAAMLMFQMASDRAKWSIYAQKSGTKGVNAPPFCAGNQCALIARGQICTHTTKRDETRKLFKLK